MAQAPPVAKRTGARKAARPGADVLHRLDGDPVARLSAAFLPSTARRSSCASPSRPNLQWLMPVFWIGFNIAMFPASVVVKHRGGLIVMGAAGLLGALAVLGAETGRQSQHADRRAVHRRCGLGLHADGARSRRRWRSARPAPRARSSAWSSPRWRSRPLRGWRRSPAACRSCRNTRRCCNGRRWRAGRSPARACW